MKEYLLLLVFTAVFQKGNAQSSNPIEVVAPEGGTAILPCRVTASGRTVMWKTSASMISYRRRLFIEDPRFSLSLPNVRRWNLQISPVQKSDENIYMCVINTYPITLKRIQLKVISLPRPPRVNVTAILDSSISFYVVNEDEADVTSVVVTIVRQPDGYPDHRRYGMQDGRNDRTVRIGGLMPRTSHIFHFAAENNAGRSALTSITATTLPQVPPRYIFLSVSPEVVRKGDDVVITCRALSELPLQFTWRHNGTSLQVRKPALEIPSVNTNSAGTYTCTADNGIPPALTKTISLSILGPPSNVRLTVSSDEVTTGDNVTLTCDAVSEAPVNFTWLHNGKLMSETGPVLKLCNVNERHTGEYTCIADNGVPPTTQISKRIDIHGKPQAPIITVYRLTSTSFHVDIEILETKRCSEPHKVHLKMYQLSEGYILKFDTEFEIGENVNKTTVNNQGLLPSTYYMLEAKTYSCGGESIPTLFNLRTRHETPSAASTTPVTVRSDIACNGDSISVFVPKNLLPAGQRVTWRDQDCSVSDNGTHYIGSVDFSGCGTTVQFTNDSVQFRNELISHNNNIGNISSVIDFGSSYDTVVPVECVYPKKANTMSSYLPIHERVQFKERRMGHLRLQMQQTADATFHDTLPQQQDGSPRKVPINQNIFIKLSSTAANRSDVGIRVDNCVATPTPSPADSTFQTLVDDGCPAIGAVTRYDSPSDEARFGVRAFQFSASPASLVYVHCQVSVCPTSDPQCITSCTPASRKRRSVQSDHESHLVSSGPYLLVAEQGSAQVATIVAAVCGLLAVVATTFAVIVWKKKRPTENSCST